MSKEWVEKEPKDLKPDRIGQVVGLKLLNGSVQWGTLELLQDGEGHTKVFKLQGKSNWGYSPLETGGDVKSVFVQDWKGDK